MGFNEVGDFSTFQNLNMAIGDNLFVRVGGVDMSADAAGYATGYWHLGLMDDRNYVVGWAKDSSPVPGRKDWLTGKYSGSALYGLVDGEKPVSLLLIYDALNDGIGDVIGTTLYTGADDLVFTGADIIFGNDVLPGGISKLPAYIAANGGQSAILPNMVVVIPEPTTITILALGGLSLIRRRFS